MIGYAVREAALRKRIERDAPSWLARAEALTSQLQAAGRYLDEAAGWGEIKQIYMRLQHHKCGYCERKLAGGQRREHDIEHFRPKSRIDAYPDTLGFATGSAHPGGYHLLALHPLNYVVACKTCNGLEEELLPGCRNACVSRAASPDYAGEQPYLVHPLGMRSDDECAPDKVITFTGTVARPAIQRDQDEHWHRVGFVTIRWLGLNRDGLQEERARILVQMFPLLERVHTGSVDSPAEPSGRSRSERQALDSFIHASAAHASCARAFVALYERDRNRARELVDASRRYLKRLGRY